MEIPERYASEEFWRRLLQMAKRLLEKHGFPERDMTTTLIHCFKMWSKKRISVSWKRKSPLCPSPAGRRSFM